MPNVEEVLLARVSPSTCYTFQTLMNAVGKSYVMQGQDPITLFVPNDAAFEGLHEGTIYDLLKDISKLEELLNFHLVPMRLTIPEVASFALQLADQEASIISDHVRTTAAARRTTLQVDTLSGYPLTLNLTERGLQVSGVEIYEADIVADNGVVHILENILWPPELSVASFVPGIQPRKLSYTPSRDDPGYAPQVDAYTIAQNKPDSPTAPLFDDWQEQRELTSREPNRQNPKEEEKH